jgi:hypothetical protein
MPRRYVLEDERLFARLYDLNRAVEALSDHRNGAHFETIVKVTADFGMTVEAALTPRVAETMRAGLPLLAEDASGKPVRRLKLFDGRFTLEWPYVKHTLDKGGV